MLRVVKLGGSLLMLPDVWSRVQIWLQRQAPAQNVMIVGGGALVDALRRYDTVHVLPPERSHWLALDAMGITAKMAASMLPGVSLIDDLSQINTGSSKLLTVLDVRKFLMMDLLTPGQSLPLGWEVTSDSIAARVAQVIVADELVLLKSSLPKGSANCEQLAASGYVDSCFPQVALHVSEVRCVDLRSDDYVECFSKT